MSFCFLVPATATTETSRDAKSLIDLYPSPNYEGISQPIFESTEVAMKRKIELTVGTLSGALDRFEQVWRQAEAGKTRPAEIRLTFESLPLLLKNLTPARWTLLEAVKRSGPMSINKLARLLGRNYKNVHTDVSGSRNSV